MKCFVVLLACVAAATALRPSFNSPGVFGSSLNAYPSVTKTRPSSPPVGRVSADARSASILKYGNEVQPDGSYNYFYETDNGISAQEQGVPRNFGGNPPVITDVAQGSFSWTSPEGQAVAITYVADENGYQPVGDAIPTPPPVPPQIARALEWIARNAPGRK